MSKYEKTTTYTNPNTGEFYEKKTFVDMQFDEEEGYLFWNKKSSIRTFLDMPLPREFSWADKGRINEIKHYMMKDSQLLVYRSNNCLKALGISQLSRIWGLSEKHTKNLIRKMKQYGIIKEVKTSGAIYFAFNPMYGSKAKRVSLLMFLWFQDEFKKVMPKWVIDKFIEQAEELRPSIEIIK